MKHKVLIFKWFLISGLVIAFLLVSNEGKTEPDQSISSKISQKDTTDIGGSYSLKDSNGTEEIKKELKDTKALLSLKLDIRLAGTVRLGKEYTYALVVDEKQGEHKLYSVGESIKGAKLLKIDKEDIVVEKDGRAYVLRITGGSYTDITHSEVESLNGPPSIGISEKLPPFGPVITENGPPSIGVSEELPAFEPIVTENGPQSIGISEELPPFVPIVIGTNPPMFGSLDSEKELPDE